MTTTKRLVLLSGGLDSVAALHEATEESAPGDVRAVGFRYRSDTPHVGNELHAAGVIAKRLGIPYDVLLLVELGHIDPTAGLAKPGISRAFLPGRNLLFLTRAAMHAAAVWPGERVDLVIGANRDDATGFPDCRRDFFDTAARTLSAAFAGAVDLRIRTPWLEMTKAEIVAWAKDRPLALRNLHASVSCYRGTRCGACDPCALRAAAFAANGIEDCAPVYTATGGDTAREARFTR